MTRYQYYRHYAWISGICLTCVLALLKLGLVSASVAAALGIPLLLSLAAFGLLAARSFGREAPSPESAGPKEAEDEDDDDDDAYGDRGKSMKKMGKLRLKAEKKSWKRREKERKGGGRPDD